MFTWSGWTSDKKKETTSVWIVIVIDVTTSIAYWKEWCKEIDSQRRTEKSYEMIQRSQHSMLHSRQCFQIVVRLSSIFWDFWRTVKQKIREKKLIKTQQKLLLRPLKCEAWTKSDKNTANSMSTKSKLKRSSLYRRPQENENKKIYKINQSKCIQRLPFTSHKAV